MIYLLDTNILRHYAESHPNLMSYLQIIPKSQMALPSIVAAEALVGRCEFVLKATPIQAAAANELLLTTLDLVQSFRIIVFDQACAAVMAKLLAKHKGHKLHADLMIAAIAIAGGHVVVTRNRKDFADLLPALQLQNWIDDPPRG